MIEFSKFLYRIIMVFLCYWLFKATINHIDENFEKIQNEIENLNQKLDYYSSSSK